ncbi:hypothetical protein [Nostoc sp. C052]|nr:hypothetical protein [Nostoc sp. C052]
MSNALFLLGGEQGVGAIHVDVERLTAGYCPYGCTSREREPL